MDKEIINILKNHGCLYMADDYKELLNDIENHYKQAQALQSLQSCAIVNSLNKKWAILREQAVKVAETNAIRHCLELYANFEIDDEEIEKAVNRYRTGN